MENGLEVSDLGCCIYTPNVVNTKSICCQIFLGVWYKFVFPPDLLMLYSCFPIVTNSYIFFCQSYDTSCKDFWDLLCVFLYFFKMLQTHFILFIWIISTFCWNNMWLFCKWICCIFFLTPFFIVVNNYFCCNHLRYLLTLLMIFVAIQCATN